MAVTSTDAYLLHAGNGVTVTFQTPFFQQPADLRVVFIEADGDEVVLELGTHYSLAGALDPDGGSCTIIDVAYRPDEAGDGTQLLIEYDLLPVQLRSFPSSGPAPTQEFAGGLDKLTLLAQQVLAKLARTFVVSFSETLDDNRAPAVEHNKLIGWHATAKKLANLVGLGQLLRAPDGESMNPLPQADARANQLLIFDGSGNPGTIDPSSIGGGGGGGGDLSANLTAFDAASGTGFPRRTSTNPISWALAAIGLSDVTGLVSALSGKASASDVATLTTTVAGKADSSTVTALTATVAGKADAPIAIADVTNLESTLTALAGDGFVIAAIDPDPGDGTDGNHHLNITSGDFFTKESGAWVLQGNLKGDDGEPGRPFFIDIQAPFASRSLYDAEVKGFTFFATDTGDLYYKLSATSADWSAAIPFQGPAGADGTDATFVFDAVGSLAGRAAHDGEAAGFTYLNEDDGVFYVKKSITSADWSDAIPFGQGAPGVDVADKTSDYTLTAADLDAERVIRFDSDQLRALFVPTALKSTLGRLFPFQVVNLGDGAIQVLPEGGSGSGGEEPTNSAAAVFEEAKLFAAAPNGSETNGGTLNVPTGLSNRYLVVAVAASTETSKTFPVATATFAGNAMTLIDQSPAHVAQNAVRVFLFGYADPAEGDGVVTVTFSQPDRILTSAVVPLLLAGVNADTPYTGEANIEKDNGQGVFIDLALDGVIPAESLLLGIGTMRENSTLVTAESSYIYSGNCGTTATQGQRWAVAAKSGGSEGTGKTINWEWAEQRQSAAVGAAFVPAIGSGASVLPAFGELAETAGPRARLVCLYEAYDDGGTTRYRCFTEGGASA